MDAEFNDMPSYVRANRNDWNMTSDVYQEQHGSSLAGTGSEAWGVWRIPESEVRALGEVSGRDILELGCGAAQWSIALAQRGAQPVGLDVSARQLMHARRNMAERGVTFPLMEGSAEQVPVPDASFDIVFCDHGAMTFADPYRTVPEAARLLRAGGRLIFALTSPFLLLCIDHDTDRVGSALMRSYFDLWKIQHEGTAEFQLPYGTWVSLFVQNGFDVERLVHLRPPLRSQSTYDFVPVEWARSWPAEDLWVVRKRTT